LVLTYVDAMDPTTPLCDGFADVETAGDRSRSGAGSSADEGTEKEKEKDERKNVVALATARSAASRVVSGSRFSGNAAAAAASVAPARTVTCDGARCLWDPDAHFALLRVRAAWAQLAEQRRRSVSGDVPKSNGCEREDVVAGSRFSGNARDAETSTRSARTVRS
jgi:hypothetical protein